MKRSGFKQRSTSLKRTPFLSNSKPVKQVSDKKRAYRASDEGKEAMLYMGKVKQLPCAVCRAPAPSDAHHVICGRYGTRKASDFDVIPLCAPCHRYPHPGAIHTNKTAWVERNGSDTDYIEQTREAVRQLDHFPHPLA